LANLAAWSNDWQMLFIVEKCKVVHMDYNNTCHEYSLSGSKLESEREQREEKDLGDSTVNCDTYRIVRVVIFPYRRGLNDFNYSRLTLQEIVGK